MTTRKSAHESHKRNILLLIPNLGPGGAQVVFRDQLAEFSKHFNVKGCVFNWTNAFTSDQALDIVSLDVPAGKNFLLKISYFFSRILRLRKLKKELNIHLTISHLEGADYVNILSARSSLYCWIHGTKQYDRNISGFIGAIRKNVLMPFLYKKADKIICVSERITNELAALGVRRERLATITNGVDISLIQKMAAESIEVEYESLLEKHQIILTHCRLAEQKNLDALIRILAELRQIKPVKCIVIGDGPLRDQLLELARQMNLKTHNGWATDTLDESCDIFFPGHRNNPFPYLAKSSLFIMTSMWEGFPLALCEAMACGCPVVTADCYTGPREVLAGGEVRSIDTAEITPFGILLPVPETAEHFTHWARVVSDALSDTVWLAAQSDAVKERARLFDKPAVVEKWVKLIE